MSTGTTQGPGTTWSGPLISGTKKDADAAGPANTGLALLRQVVTLTVNGTNAVSGLMVLPKDSQIVDIIADTTVAWNSGTSDTLSVGATAGGTDYVSGTSVATTGRQRANPSAAELVAMQNIGNNVNVYATVTPAGTAATTGTTDVTLLYIQTVQTS